MLETVLSSDTGGTGRLSREYPGCVANERNVQQVLYKPFTINELLDTIFSGRIAGSFRTDTWVCKIFYTFLTH
jgi:hypothetical protein